MCCPLAVPYRMYLCMQSGGGGRVAPMIVGAYNTMGQETFEREDIIWGLGSLPAFAKRACVHGVCGPGGKLLEIFTLLLSPSIF